MADAAQAEASDVQSLCYAMFPWRQAQMPSFAAWWEVVQVDREGCREAVARLSPSVKSCCVARVDARRAERQTQRDQSQTARQPESKGRAQKAHPDYQL
jgi:hypothetical protein